ncbi:LysR substrate-binding domain-containing protein [Thalassococcus sp. S3]|uniref:LysR substrate-binding domain-containing protein n=1 Tax=Thalassococcus sp. S3 TaxID=2017482 RepID=UPI0010249007|nr:LysR substrate-binding domain-containing protein [Thalassococcus sp. S3]QBF29975.1 LysR family transcriptional regulator [Thalassococcus sp. S3]
MHRNLPPLNALRAFEAAGRHESFSRAAEELGVSHSAISRHVRGLEDRLGAQLFRDAARGVMLTRDGRAYLDRVTPALDVIGEATDSVAETPSGRLTVSSEPLFAAKAVIPRLPDFYETFPEVELRLDASHALADLERYEADIAIRFAHSGVLDVPSDVLSTAPLYPFSAPGLLPDNRITPEAVRTHRLYKDRGNPVWETWCAAAGFPDGLVPDSRWRMMSQYALEATLHGLGLYLGAFDAVEYEVRSGRLVQVSEIGIRDGAYHLLCSQQGMRRKAVRQFRTWLLEQTQHLRAG